MAPVVRVKSGSKFEDMYAYSRLVEADGWIYSSNTAGRNYQTRELAPDAAGQASKALDNLENAMAALNAKLSDIVRIQVTVDCFENVDPVMKTIAERVRGNDPGHTVIISALPDKALKVELAIVAYKRDPGVPDEVRRVTV